MAPAQRRLYTFGAAIAAAVTVVFATIGDGVSTDSPGIRGALINHGHTVVWGLLTCALTVAAIRDRWSRASSVLATAALTVYALFLGALLL